VAVIGIKDAKWGERPLPLVVRRPGASADAATIQKHLSAYASRGEISRYAVPEQVLFVSAIEKTSVGKIDKKLLRQKYQSA
jgi:fatty-acyl-CoA synthase